MGGCSSTAASPDATALVAARADAVRELRKKYEAQISTLLAEKQKES